MDEIEKGKTHEESQTFIDKEEGASQNINNDILKNTGEVENNSDVFTSSGNENEVITILTQENNEGVFLYERSEDDGVHTESIGEFIQVCDDNNAFGEINNCQNENVIIVDVIEEEVNQNCNKEINCQDEKLKQFSSEEKIQDQKVQNELVDICNVSEEKASTNGSGNQFKNFKNVILEDWEVEVPHLIENNEGENITNQVVIEEPQSDQMVNTKEVVNYSKENCEMDLMLGNENENNTVKTKESDSLPLHKKDIASVGGILKGVSEKKTDTLKFSNSIFSKEDIVEILDKSMERVVKPIIGKDLFFSIELTKKLNQELSLSTPLKKNVETEQENNASNESEVCNNNTIVDDRQKIVDILEADEIKDWKSVPNKSNLISKENGNDMEISKAIKNMEEIDSKKKTPVKPKKTSFIKFRTMDKELERTIALQQLREEFPSTRKRSKTTRKLNRIPFLASTDLEKALTSHEVSAALKPGTPKRRPCYLPENLSDTKKAGKIIQNKTVDDKKKQFDENSLKKRDRIERQVAKNINIGEKSKIKCNSETINLDLFESADRPKNVCNTVVRTYTVKRKSTDTENDIKSTLEAVTKALNETKEESNESKPKKLKTATKSENKLLTKNKILVKKKRKLKSDNAGEKKRNLELEKLLGDEGAVRMLYDTQHGDGNSVAHKKSKIRTTSGLKKDLLLKTKLVKNAVMRLSGVGSEGVSLRGKRRSIKSETQVSSQDSEPLFSSTPNIVLYKPKKKQKADASRILYRHSSSESFDSSEGYRRTSFDADSLNMPAKDDLNNKEDDPENVNSANTEDDKLKPIKSVIVVKKRLRTFENAKRLSTKEMMKVSKVKNRTEGTKSVASGPKLDLSNVPLRKSSRARMVSKKYSVWSSTSMDSLSVESLGLKKVKKASLEIGKKLNCKELIVLQYENLVQIVFTPISTVLKNSLNQEVLNELIQAFTFLSEETSCKVVLLTSTGSSFCQGVDLNQIISAKENERKNIVSQLINTIREFVTCLANFKKPVIVGVHAGAVGLGVTLLPYCDLVICSDKASFYTPYVKLGQAPEGAPTNTFPRIHRHLVSELLFKNHKMTATDALKYGLVTQVIPEDRYEEELMMLSRNLAAQPVQGMQSIKYLQRKNEQEIFETLQLEGKMLEEHWNSNECLNRIIKFLNSGELHLKYLDNT